MPLCCHSVVRASADLDFDCYRKEPQSAITDGAKHSIRVDFLETAVRLFWLSWREGGLSP